MSRRISIATALAEKLKEINGESPYTVNLNDNVFPKLKFWDEVSDFPCVYVVAGSEQREYHPGGFTWAFLNISLKLYCRGEDSQTELEDLIEDVENLLDSTLGRLTFNTTKSTEEISVVSITTDEGLLTPYAVGEINILVRYSR